MSTPTRCALRCSFPLATAGIFAIMVLACADPVARDDGGGSPDESALLTPQPARTTSPLTSRAPAAYAVLGHFEATIDPRTGIATVRMLDAQDKSAATPGFDESLEQNRDPGDFSDSREGTLRFEQDASGNGQTVSDCADFWIDGWDDFDSSWPFWKPPGARAGWLADLEGDPGETRFCTNFRLRNDYITPIRDLWIIVDGFTLPSVRAFIDTAPRSIPNPVPGEPDIDLEPFSAQGMFRYGRFEPGETINGQWYFYFGGAPVSSFNVRGRLVDILAEVCGNNQDNNGDGLVDNGCGTYQAQDPCIINEDCLSNDCVDGIPGEFGSFTLGECALSPIGGSCFDDDDCSGGAPCIGGDQDSLTIGTCSSTNFGAPCVNNSNCASDTCDTDAGVCTHPSGLAAGCFDTGFGACHAAFASPDGTDNASCGDLATNPCRRPTVAMTNQAGRTAVALATGNYFDDITLEGSQAPSLLGGFNVDFTTRSSDAGDRASISAEDSPGLLVRDLSAAVSIEDVNITGGDASTDQPAIGLEVRNAGTHLTAQRSSITAGNGSNGSDGTDGTDGERGDDGQNAEGRLGAPAGTGPCRGGQGGAGALDVAGESGNPGGDAPGSSMLGGQGGAGGPGAPSAFVAIGQPGMDGQEFFNTIWMGSPAVHGSFEPPDFLFSNPSAQNGADGACGRGGGGGGGAGAFQSAGPTFSGGGGGAGGSGGEGGQGGTGGSSGTPSIGLLAVASTVELGSVDITTGNAGHGGTGGRGGAGGDGGDGGAGYNPGTGAEGGAGGHGRAGAPGGCGGSGNGGWTIGILRLDSSTVTESGVTISHGTPGSAGGAVAGCNPDLPNNGVNIDRL